MATTFTTLMGTQQNQMPKKGISQRLVKEATQSYVFSFGWCIGGILVLAVLIGAVYGLRTVRFSRMSSQFIELSETLEKEGRLREAVDVLGAFLLAEPAHSDVWSRQCDLWERLYKERLFQNPNQMKEAVRQQKFALGRIAEDESQGVQERILDMEWDMARYEPTSIPAVIVDAKNLLKTWRDNPKALRILALGWYRQIPLNVLQKSEDSPVDQLLQDALNRNPGDIEVSVALANFNRKVGTDPQYQKYASSTIRERDTRSRDADSIDLINNMVSRNADAPQAYLERYLFRANNNLLDKNATTLDPDLSKALELDPDFPGALLQAGIQSSRISLVARRAGETGLADERWADATAFFKKTIDKDPSNVNGYIFLGEIYAQEGNSDKTVEIWEDGRKKVQPGASMEMLSRLAVLYIERKNFDGANEVIETMRRFFLNNSTRIDRAVAIDLERTIDLIRGKLYFAKAIDTTLERNAMLPGLDAVQKSGDVAKIKENELKLAELTAAAETNKAAARGLIDKVMESMSPNDYDTAGTTMLSRLEGEALINMAKIEADNGFLESAGDYFIKAIRFPQVAQTAILQGATARLLSNRPDQAIGILRDGVQAYPDNQEIRFRYVSALFQQDVVRTDAASRNYDLVESELAEMSKNRDKLTTPWAIDVMQIQLKYVKEGGTLAAQQTALNSLRELENEPTLANDLKFLAELAGQYSIMGSLEDFQRTVDHIRLQPGGETVYFAEKISDAIRRRDTDAALVLADEALTTVPEAEKSRFELLKKRIENPSEGQIANIEEQYDFLKKQFEDNRVFDPRTFFELADLALERGDEELAKTITERLKQIEGDQGVHWRFLQGKQCVKQAQQGGAVFLENARTIQRELVGKKPDWNMCYVLLGDIEETAGNIEAATDAYQQAISKGNRQPALFHKLVSLYYKINKPEEGDKVTREAIGLFGPGFSNQEMLFKPPYQGFYEQIQLAISDGNLGTAEKLADDCLKKAAENKEPSDEIINLNTAIGKLFMDASHPEIAERFLLALAKFGGQYSYPLAVCLAKMGKVDEGFGILLDEFEKNPDGQANLTPILVLISQIKPSDEFLAKMDQTVLRFESRLITKIPTIINLGQYWMERGKYDFALRAYQKGYEMAPDNLVILNNLSLILAGCVETNEPGSASPVARGTLKANEPNRIALPAAQPVQSLFLSFPGSESGQNLPNPADFKFITQ